MSSPKFAAGEKVGGKRGILTAPTPWHPSSAFQYKLDGGPCWNVVLPNSCVLHQPAPRSLSLTDTWEQCRRCIQLIMVIAPAEERAPDLSGKLYRGLEHGWQMGKTDRQLHRPSRHCRTIAARRMISISTRYSSGWTNTQPIWKK
jgi:hypothetical protein